MERLVRPEGCTSSGEFDERLECSIRNPTRSLAREPLYDASVSAPFNEGAIRGASGTVAALIII